MGIVSSSIKIIGGRIISIFISFLTGVILARYLGAEDRGLLSLYLYTIGFVVLILNGGIAESSIYLLNRGDLDKNLIIRNQIFYLFNISLIFVIVTLLLKPFIGQIKSSDFYCLIPIVALMLFNSLFRHYLLSEKKIGFYTSSVIIENIGYLILVFITAVLKLSFLFILLSNLASQVIVLIYLTKKLKLVLPKFGFPLVNFLYIKESYAFGLHLFFTGLGGFGLQRLGFYVLNYFSGTRSVGLYTVASTLPSIYENLPQQISTIAYTYAAAENDVNQRKKIAIGISKLVLYCVFFAALPVFFFADKIVILIFGSEFKNLGDLTILLTISTIFSGLSGIFYNFLAGIGKPKFGTYLTILNLSVIFITSVFFVSHFGLIGAAWAKLVSSIVSVVFIGYFFLRQYKIALSDILLINKGEWNLLVNYLKHLIH